MTVRGLIHDETQAVTFERAVGPTVRRSAKEKTLNKNTLAIHNTHRALFKSHSEFCLAIVIWILASLPALGEELLKPVWLVSNGFHTSLGFRTRDLPFAKEISGDPEAHVILIGWGARDFYEGEVNPWTVVEAICGIGGSILHVVPVRGPISKRFSHSDVIEMELPQRDFGRLIKAVNQAFARDASHRRVFVRGGYYADSRFYAGVEHFYFPKMCNVWVAEKLRRGGARICVLNSIAAFELIWQAEKLGKREQRLQRPKDVF